MTQLTNVYAVALGTWTAGPWVGEAAQFGLRLCPVSKIGAPDAGTMFTPIETGDVAQDQGFQTGAHGTLTKTWTARIGPVGSVENWDADWQIGVAEDLWTFLDTLKAYFASTFRWAGVKMGAVAGTGRIVQNSSVYTFTTPLAGTGSTALPPQLAMAVTMRANILGRKGRGRIYLPALTQSTIASDGTVATAFSGNTRTAMKALIDGLQDVPPTNAYMPIVSVMSADSAHPVRPSEVRTGNRMDTIQSRRRQVAEAYTSLNL